MQKRTYARTRRTATACLVLLSLVACRRRGDQAAADSANMSTPTSDVAASIPFDASINCTQAATDVEKLVCGDSALSALDQRLASVYKEAEVKQGSPVPAWLPTEQRNWNAERDACGRSGNAKACVDSAYTRRIASLQATSLLVSTRGPVIYRCSSAESSHDELVAMFAETEPPSVVLERGDKRIVAFRTRAASGSKYEGGNVMFWSKGKDAQVLWLGRELKCHEEAQTS